MARLPPFLTRLATVYLTQALTRRLQQSPAFFRLVDRLVHEADHFPKRLQGQPVPPYISRDPHEPTLSEQAQDAWQRQVNDIGEPHDMPDPFNPDRTQPVTPANDALQQRQRAQDSFQASKRNAEHARERSRQRGKRAEQDRGMDEMRKLLDKLRQENAPDKQ